MTTHVNKVHHVTTITQVAKDPGVDEDWLWDIANELEIEDGVIWVYGVGDDGIQAFTDFGIENLIELIRFYKENPGLLCQSACKIDPRSASNFDPLRPRVLAVALAASELVGVAKTSRARVGT